MPTIKPSAGTRSPVSLGPTFVVMVGDEPCVVRATGVRPIADVLAAPEAEALGWEEMSAIGLLDRADEAPAGSGGMIAAPRVRRRRDRPLASRATLLSRPRD